MQHKLPILQLISIEMLPAVVNLLPLNYSAVPKILDCGYCLVGGVKFVEFQCTNVGVSTGKFCIIPKNQWPVTNLRVITYIFNRNNSIHVAIVLLTGPLCVSLLRLWPEPTIASRRPSLSARRSFTCSQAKALWSR